MDEKDKILYDPDLLNQEIDIINNEIQEIDNLYAEIKRHYDIVKNSASRGSLTFVEKQTSNLINLKNAKLNYIRERVNAKKAMTDYGFKEVQVTKKSEGTSNDELSEMIIEKITETFTYNGIIDTKESELEYSEDNLDDILDERLDDEDKEYVNNVVGKSTEVIEDDIEEYQEEIIIEEEMEEDEEATFYAVDLNSNTFYLLDDEMEIVEELGEGYDVIDHTEFIEDSEYAIGKSNNLYLCIELE